MDKELLVIQDRVNGLIYNPFINLKDQVKELKKLLSKADKYSLEITRLDNILTSLDEFENLPYGNIERIKGFNKMKSQVLKIMKEIQSP